MSKQADQGKTSALSFNLSHATHCSSCTALNHVNDDLGRPGLRRALKRVVRALHVRQLEAVRGCSSSTASRHINDDLDRPGLRGALKHVICVLHVRQLEAVRDQLARAQAPQRSLQSTCALF